MPEPTAQDRISLSRMIHTAYTIRVPCCLVSDHDLPSSVRLLIWSPFTSATSKAHFPLEVAASSLSLGRARGETLNMSPRYAEGVEERLYQPATLRPVVVRGIVPSGTPCCNPAW